MTSLVLVGGGGHCQAVIDVIEKTGRWQIAGIVDSDPNLKSVADYPVLGTDSDLPDIARNVRHAIITVGQIKTFSVRARLYERLKSSGFELATIISPLAEVSRRATVGAGTVVMHFGCIGPGAHVGHNCIINTRALVEHGARVGNHCHVSTTAVLNGDVIVGDGSFIGSGSVIREGVAVGDGCIVAMGAIVSKSLPAGSVYLGGTSK